MALINPNPIEIPATEAKEFPHVWLSNIIIHAPSTTSGRITIECLPYNGNTKEIEEGKFMQSISTDNLWKALAEVPEVAQAMGAIFTALQPLKEWIELQNQEQNNQNI